MGEKMNKISSSLILEYLDEKYKNYYYITEYDGIEEINIDFYKYFTDAILIILNENTNDNIKINNIRKLITSTKQT
jgi:hypothetical protein